MSRSRFWLCLLVGAALAFASGAFGRETAISIRFPGGNVLVGHQEGDRVELAPDWRDSRPWFYWQFEAAAGSAGRVLFTFTNSSPIGVQGPAFSVDQGASWQWLGTDTVQIAGEKASFAFTFTNASRPVRFCVAVPYLQRDLDLFLAAQKGNPHLLIDVLTKSLKGRPVELLRIGKPGPGIQAVLVTARHHACESMASYVLEGFMKEAMAASPAGAAFRSRYVLYAVPLVDTDGVQAGDQGKGRLPHDHNRDYGTTNIYPEVRAIQALGRDKKVELAMDFHCPALRGESHTVFYMDGIAVPPTYSNAVELSSWAGEEVPQAISRGPFPWLKKPAAVASATNLPFAHYFAAQPGVRMAVTLETPYALPGYPFDAAMARAYGASLLKAWVRTDFPAAGQPRRGGYADYEAFQKTLRELILAKPGEAERLANRSLADEQAPALYRTEARHQLGVLHFRQKRYPEALADFEAVAGHADATARQRCGALAQRVLVVCADPASGVAAADRALADFQGFPYAARDKKAQVHAAVSLFYEKTNLLDRAMDHAREQLAVVPAHEKGRTLVRIAALHDKLHQPDQAIQCRQEAVALLRRQLSPFPQGAFGPLMAADLLNALNGIPTATGKEKQEAAAMTGKSRIQPDVAPKTSSK